MRKLFYYKLSKYYVKTKLKENISKIYGKQKAGNLFRQSCAKNSTHVKRLQLKREIEGKRRIMKRKREAKEEKQTSRPFIFTLQESCLFDVFDYLSDEKNKIKIVMINLNF